MDNKNSDAPNFIASYDIPEIAIPLVLEEASRAVERWASARGVPNPLDSVPDSRYSIHMTTMKRTKAEQIERLTNDLAEAQKALRDVVNILSGISSGSDQVFYDIGRAQGTASRGLTMSGAYQREDVK